MTKQKPYPEFAKKSLRVLFAWIALALVCFGLAFSFNAPENDELSDICMLLFAGFVVIGMGSLFYKLYWFAPLKWCQVL